jgi:hypothetical protein
MQMRHSRDLYRYDFSGLKAVTLAWEVLETVHRDRYIPHLRAVCISAV